MSRISDALRKSEQEKTGLSSSTAWMPSSKIKQANVPRDESPTGFENVEHIAVRIMPSKHIVTCEDTHAPGAEKFRVLRHRLQKIRAERPLSKLLVSSPVPREGKTLVAVNLAFSLAKISRRVLLIDADLRNPGIHSVFGLKDMPGLTEYLKGEIEDRAAIRRLDPWNLYYLPAGRCSEAPGELLQGARVGGLLKRLGEVFDWIVVDTAPITLFADTPHLANLVDGSVLVTRVGVTPTDTIQDAVAALEGNFIAGVVINGDTETSKHQYSYYGYSGADQNDEPLKDEKILSEKDTERG